MPLILQSMATNPSVSWYVPTDGDFDSPDNVHQVRMSLDAFQERCQQHFDFPLALGSAYKITDLRPAFGEIFADELRGSGFGATRIGTLSLAIFVTRSRTTCSTRSTSSWCGVAWHSTETSEE